MRLGKTLIIIRRLRQVLGSILVVAPNDALISWEDELTRENEPYLRITGTREQRLDQLNKSYSRIKYILTNKEAFISIPELANFRWHAVVLDESTFLKNPKSQVSGFFTNNFRLAQHRIILTGTPAPESSLDYFQQLKFLTSDILREHNYYQFRMRHFKQLGYDWVLLGSGKKFLTQQLVKHCYTLKRRDVNLDSKKIYEKRAIELPKPVRDAYDEVKATFSLRYAETRTDKKTIYATDVFNWLRQMTSGIIDNNIVHSEKILSIINLLQGELKNDQVVVWTNYILENKTLQAHLKHSGINCQNILGETRPETRSTIVKAFQLHKYRVLICQVQCAKFGLNLSAARTAIYYSCPLAFIDRSQSEDRILNINDKSPLLYIDIVARDTVDEDILDSLKYKLNEQKLIEKLVKEIKRDAA
jgi:SNF2 family DNA or RNA helicase